MSILLDALRKSEEQRRLGATPTLQTPERALDLAHHEQRHWIPVVMMALAAVAIAWLGAVQFRHPEPVPAPAAVESLATDVPLRAETTRADHDKLAVSAEVPPATTPVKDFIAEPEAPVAPQAADSPGVAAQNARAGPGGRRVRSESTVSLVSAATSEESATPEVVVAVEEPIAALVEDLSTSDVAARPDRDQLEPYAAEPISYWQIPQSLRESMPEMRITVLVYAENPQDRFLLINGKRLREKDEVSDGLVVEEIQRDRAIFTFRDYRFQLKG